MLVYRGMDIGTEKPSAAMQCKIQHHLIDVVDPWEEYSVGRYVKDFERVTNELYQKGKPFIVVGGTALYLKAIVDGLFEGPPADWEYRNHLRIHCCRTRSGLPAQNACRGGRRGGAQIALQ